MPSYIRLAAAVTRVGNDVGTCHHGKRLWGGPYGHVRKGYLAYDATTGTARVHNEEVRAELTRAVSESRHTEVARIVRESDALLRATWDMDDDEVAKAISAAHDHGCAPVFYNDEQALRAVVSLVHILEQGPTIFR